MYDLQTKPNAQKLAEMLSYIDANNYDNWFKVSLVLGREYPNNPEVLSVLHSWAETASERHSYDFRKEEKNFNSKAQGSATLRTIIRLARAGGYVNHNEQTEKKLNLKQKVVIANVVDEHSDTYTKHNDNAQAIIKWLFTCKHDDRVKFILNNSQNIYFLPESEQNIL